MIIKRFNKDGLIAFEDLLRQFRADKKIDAIKLIAVRDNPNFSDEIEGEYTLPTIKGTSKFEIARQISTALNLGENKNLYYDRGLWNWLSSYFLEKLVVVKKGTAELDFKEDALYQLETDSWNRYYRHLLAFPCWIYSELEEKGQIFLRGSIHERGEIVEQLAAVQDIQRNKGIVEAATILYYDEGKGSIVKGAASKDVGGTARRFREVIQQFKMTFDLNSMDGAQIVTILPMEFDKWRKAS
ncbi:MAG: hypothetical protein KF744_03955 [Taibaiella sp.]|nr:hypothetical protein [Taibaiella sp.]